MEGKECGYVEDNEKPGHGPNCIGLSGSVEQTNDLFDGPDVIGNTGRHGRSRLIAVGLLEGLVARAKL